MAPTMTYRSHKEFYRRRDEREAYDFDKRQEPENLVKTYPSISYATECHLEIEAFDKLDGSNIRAEWSKKKGWYKFGTRHRLVDASDPIFGRAPQLVIDKYGLLPHALMNSGYDRAMCFFELWGQNSFAGMHDPKDELTVTLIDIAPFKEGILGPQRFFEVCGNVTSTQPIDRARSLYRGPCTPEFIEGVRNGTLPGMTFEGVVCKAENDKKTKMPIMFKQKSRAWLQKLKTYCGTNNDLYNALI